jgi:hypothetical protein
MNRQVVGWAAAGLIHGLGRMNRQVVGWAAAGLIHD